MKKLLMVIVVLIAAVAGAVVYFASGANDFIRTQIESQGERYLGTQVSVASVDLQFSEGKMVIHDIDVENPDGFSAEDAFSLGAITVDIAGQMQEPYRIEEITLDAPEVLFELDAEGNANLMVIKDHLMATLPEQSNQPTEKEGAAPLLIVDAVTISNVKLTLNAEKLVIEGVELDKKIYEVSLPTFNAGAIGQPDGLPADQVGSVIVQKMLDNIVRQAKQQVKDIVADEVKRKAQQQLDEKKDELLEKGKEKLKDLF